MTKLDELNELLASVAPKPKPLAKPKVEYLRDKLASPPDLDRSREVLAQSQVQFHEEELRRLKPNEKLLRNKRLFGRTSGPLPPDEQRLLNLQISTNQARGLNGPRKARTGTSGATE
jgi:hypothetical protein